MSQRDLVTELRAARVAAPPEVRERVRLIASADAAPTRRVTWRRVLVVLVPVAAAIAATVLITRPSHTTPGTQTAAFRALVHGAAPAPSGKSVSTQAAPATVPGSPTRAQRYGASLSLRVADAAHVSDGVKRALRIVGSLGGYSVSIHVASARARGSADLVLKVPRAHVQQALTRLAQIGTIVGERVDVQDVQAGINAADRTIARLQRQLAALRAQPQSPAVTRRIAALTGRVVALQRARATTIRTAHFATVAVGFMTPRPATAHHHGHGPLHGLGVAFRWIGIALVYALALGVPAALVVLLVWLGVGAVRRRRVDALLSRP